MDAVSFIQEVAVMCQSNVQSAASMLLSPVSQLVEMFIHTPPKKKQEEIFMSICTDILIINEQITVMYTGK